MGFECVAEGTMDVRIYHVESGRGEPQNAAILCRTLEKLQALA